MKGVYFISLSSMIQSDEISHSKKRVYPI